MDDIELRSLSKVRLSIGSVLFPMETPSKPTTGHYARVSLFVSIVKQNNAHLGLVTCGNVFSKDLFVGTFAGPASTDPVCIGRVLMTRLGTRRDIAVVVIYPGTICPPTCNDELLEWTAMYSALDDVFVYRDFQTVHGKIIKVDSAGRSDTGRAYEGKIACTFDNLKSARNTGDLLVTLEGGRYRPIGSLWGQKGELLLFTPLTHFFDAPELSGVGYRIQQLLPSAHSSQLSSRLSSSSRLTPRSKNILVAADDESPASDVVETLTHLLMSLNLLSRTPEV